ncbi:hypothetical protein EHO59_07335 [Leptospira semungkisensis]|uniref:Uncharacterized protein n=1 Tax=Leptospira semungkisensis TaxID=2484985 RepID=A0A4R9G8C0_9LEPT|nr:hypothetical protein [Leptospira semungkisensis]TGK07898.1 hypothetical protein EHO59_07335 [Leptospira semungkisensis]
MNFLLPSKIAKYSGKIFHVFVILLTYVSFSDCSAYYFRDKVFRSESMGFFTIDSSDIPDFESITKTKSLDHPIQIDSARIKDYFGNLRYSRRSTIGYFNDFVFSDHELDLLARDLPFALKNLPKDKLLLIVSKYDDTQSVISFDEITSCIVWAAEGRLNILFGKIKRELVDKDVGLDFNRWTKIDLIRLSHSSDGTEISDGETVDFGVVDGIPLRRWVLFDQKNPGKYKFLPRKQYQPLKLTDDNDRP